MAGVHGQSLTLYVENDTIGLPQDEVVIPVLASGIDSLVGLTVSTQWDTTVFEFVEARDAFYGEMGFNGLNRTRVDSGQITILVSAEDVTTGFTDPDGTILFNLVLRPLVTATTTTEIAFVDIPTVGSVASRAPGDVAFDSLILRPATIVLDASTGLSVISETKQFQVRPNPVVGTSQVLLETGYAGPATMEVLSVDGRTIRSYQLDVRAGTNTYNLRAADLPAPGAYFLRVTTDREQFTRKIMRR